MSVDWITVTAQVFNFLVLIWLLKRFLYRPILAGIDAREADIAARVTEADIANTRAREEAATYQTALADFATSETALLDAAREEAIKERAVLQAESKVMIEAEAERWREQKAKDRAAYAVELKTAGAGAILALTRKALTDLAGVQLEEQIIVRIEAQLEELGDDLRAAAGHSETAVAITRLPLSEASHERLRRAFVRHVSNVPLRFEIEGNQAAGVTLHLGGARLGWTIDTYLDNLEMILTDKLASRHDQAGAPA